MRQTLQTATNEGIRIIAIYILPETAYSITIYIGSEPHYIMHP